MHVCVCTCVVNAPQIRDVCTARALEKRLRKVKLCVCVCVCTMMCVCMCMFVPQEKARQKKLQHQMLDVLRELREYV